MLYSTAVPRWDPNQQPPYTIELIDPDREDQGKWSLEAEG
jgi:hypothetical protein